MEASALQAPARLTGISLSAPLLRLRSDEQLVALFRAGSDEAFRAIHDRYRQRLFAYVRQMLPGSRQDAEDALQDVFIRAHGALRATDRPISLRAWLYRVAHNRCIDQLRRPVVVPLEGAEHARSNLPDPFAEAERRESLRRLIADVRRLPEQQRSVLLMRELEGASYADLADAHAVSVAAVKSLLVRARIGLVQASEARDISCVEIRTDLASAHGRGVRATGRARRHLRDCSGCREYRVALRATRRELAALSPPGGPLAALAKLIGGAGGGGAAASSGAALGGGAGAAGGAVAGGGAAAATVCKVAAVVCSTVVAAGGAVEVSKEIGRTTAGAHDAATPALTSAASGSSRATTTVAAPVQRASERVAAKSQRAAPAARAGGDPASGAGAKDPSTAASAAPTTKTSAPVTENDFPYGISERDPRARGDQSGPESEDGTGAGAVPLGSDAPAEDPDAPVSTTTDPSDPVAGAGPAQQQSGFVEVPGPATQGATPPDEGTVGTSGAGATTKSGSTSGPAAPPTP